jgi:hypothetical protein
MSVDVLNLICYYLFSSRKEISYVSYINIFNAFLKGGSNEPKETGL